MAIEDLFLKVRTLMPEPRFKPDQPVLAVGSKVQSFSLPTAQGIEFHLSSVLARGPVIINFIRGTWCPYCVMHLRQLSKWQSSLNLKGGTSLTTLIISNEPVTAIRKWLNSNPVPYLYGSDPEGKVAAQFGVKLTPELFLKPATFLIDADSSIRMAYAGKRKGYDLHDNLDTAISEVTKNS